MKKLHFTIDINAPAQRVWDTMTQDVTYRTWSAEFNSGGESYYEGSWNEGSEIRFLGPDENGNIGGMLGRIAQNKPLEFLSIEYYGEIADGKEDTTSDRVKKWAGSHENYTFKEADNITTLFVDVDANGEMETMFAEAWPKALQTLKQLCEAPAQSYGTGPFVT